MTKRQRLTLLAIILLLLALLALLLPRCTRRSAVTTVPSSGPAATATSNSNLTAAPAPTQELLTPATLEAPADVVAGAIFSVRVDGPNNKGDFVTIVRRDAAATFTGNYTDIRDQKNIQMTAPIAAGEYELRYVTARSKSVLGRAPIVITEPKVTVSGPAEAVLGTTVSISWTGPNNSGDYITVVAQSAPDGHYGNYTLTAKGSPLTVTVPIDAGDGEVRYMTGQGAKVLARSPIKIIKPEVTLSAPDRVEAGSTFDVRWTGPNNPGDYVTIVPKDLPDGRYANYTETGKGPSLKLLALIAPGEAELRYMTGTGARVLARRPITIAAAVVTLDAAAEAIAGSAVQITWTGPHNSGDYITIVPASLPDGQYARYTDTSKGSPLTVEAPLDAGAMEIRYMSGQGAKVLARRGLKTMMPQISLKVPAQAASGSSISIEWTGPNNPGDYLTIVPASAKDGVSAQTAPASRGSPLKISAPPTSGAAEVRYMSGQNHRVLGRTSLELTTR